MSPPFAQSSLVPPIVQLELIEPVRSRTIITCAGFGVPPRIAAVALALTLNEWMPSNAGKEGLRRSHLEHDDRVAGVPGTQPPNEMRHFVVTVVVTFLMLARVFWPPTSEAYCFATAVALAAFRKPLRAGERSCVGGGLEGAVRVIGVADVDDERRETEQDGERQHDENNDLTALVLRSVGLPSCLLVRNHDPEPPQSRRVRTTPIVFQLP